MLGVDVEQLCAEVAELGQRHGHIVHKGAAAAIGMYLPAHKQLVGNVQPVFVEKFAERLGIRHGKHG